MLLEPLEFLNIQDIQDNVDKYAKILAGNGIIAFRNANLSEEDQITVQKIFGSYFNIYPNLSGGRSYQYMEDHESRSEFNVSPDQLILNWHMEHIHFSNPVVLGFWNMHEFTANPGSGNTLFYDSRKLYNSIPQEWTEFLSQCTLDTFFNLEYDINRSYTPAISKHWITGENVIRVPLNTPPKDHMVLLSFGGRTPTDEEYKKYDEIVAELKNIVHNDTSIRIEHMWQQGDLVIPDMYVMYHAVLGGFKSNQRRFRGIWSFLSGQGLDS